EDRARSLRRRARALLRRKEYLSAAEALEEHTVLRPADTEFLYYTAFALKKGPQYARAIDFGERCRLRNPGLVDNLVNLADTYRRTENSQRAAALLDMAFEFDPENRKAKRLHGAIEAA